MEALRPAGSHFGPGGLKQVKENCEVVMGSAGRHFDQDGIDNPECLLANMLSQAA